MTASKKYFAASLAALVILFGALAAEVVVDGPLSPLDGSIAEALGEGRSADATQLFKTLTTLGDKYTILALTIFSILALLYKKQLAYAAGLALSVFGSMGAVWVLKEFVHRARPDTLLAAYAETSFSFPSGHATLAVALFGFLAYFFAKTAPSARLRTALVVLSILLIFFIGFSRIYLGVHYLTDVVGGFLLGTLFLLFGIALSRRRMF